MKSTKSVQTVYAIILQLKKYPFINEINKLRRYNKKMLAEDIKKFCSVYPTLKLGKFSYSDHTKLLTHDIPAGISRQLRLSMTEIVVKGSVGQGQWAEIPWVVLMHKGITTTTQSGYYIAILFSADLSTLYVSLGLGWSQFKDRYGAKSGLSKVTSYAYGMSKLIDLQEGEITGLLDLGSSKILARGYEAGNICARKFSVNSIDDWILLETIEQYIEDYYSRLMEYVGGDIFFDEDKILYKGDLTVDQIEPLDKKIKSLSSSSDKGEALRVIKTLSDTLPPQKREYITKRTIRNKAFADFVKLRAKHTCEICGRRPFIKKDGKLYAEADHVEPLYNFGVDHPDNMRCLCALCHRVITYGSEEEINKLSHSTIKI